MEKFRVELLLMDRRRRWVFKKRLKAPDPIVAGQAALILVQKKMRVDTDILRGFVRPRDQSELLAVWPLLEPSDDGVPQARRKRKWVLTRDISPQEFAEWDAYGAIDRQL